MTAPRNTAFTGTGVLTRLALRRDRITLAAWVLGLAGFTAAITEMSATSFHSTAELVQGTSLMATSPAMRLLGLASGASVGGYTMIRGYLTLAVLAALMSIFAVVRHTRQGEETGRAEMVGATAVGRHAGLAAALLVALAANAALAGLLGLAMVAVGQPVTGSFVAGAAVSAVGVVFTGVAAAATQLAASTRGASGICAAVLGVAFLASGAGNMAGHTDPAGVRVTSAWPAWLSPIGWGQQMRPFGGDRWWPLGLAAAAFLGCTAVALLLAARRDLGQGLLPQRPGRDGASRALRSPLGLALRLQRGALTGWAAAMLGFGLVLGGVIGQMRHLSGTALEWYTRMGGSDAILDAYRAAMISMAGMTVAIYAVQVLLHMRAEEADGPLEPVLAAAIGRHRWVAGHALAALLGSIGLLLAFATGMGLAAGAVLGDPAAQLRTLIVASLVQLPGILVLGAAVIAVTGLLPRLASALCWMLLLASILAGPLFGATLRLPQWVRDASPFTHVPRAPGALVGAVPMFTLVGVAAALTLAGLVTLRRRDLALPA